MVYTSNSVKLISLILLLLGTPQVMACNNKMNQPLIWRYEGLNEAKHLEKGRDILIEIERVARVYASKPLVTVLDKKKSFAEDKRYYCTISPYWWPDSSSGRVEYVRRDGDINPEYNEYDSRALDELANRCKFISSVFYITKDEQLYDVYVDLLRTWFINDETRMYPNFEYAQVLPGHNGNRGRCYGIIEAYSLNTILESIRLVNLTKKIDKKTMTSLKQWFSAFADWMIKSDLGYEESQAPNNHSIAYDVTLINMLLFAKRIREARVVADSFYENRVLKQINQDGSQPEEIKRTQPIGYSSFNISHILDFASISRYWGRIYFDKIKERLGLALQYNQYMIDGKVQINDKIIISSEGDKKWQIENILRYKALYCSSPVEIPNSVNPYRSLNALLLE